MDLKKILGFSILGHALLLGLLWYDYVHNLGPFGNGKPGLIAVSLVGEKRSTPNPLPLQKEGSSSSVTEEGGGGGKGDSLLFSEIQNKIERAKYYPLVAKRQNIEGAPVVEFKISPNGSVEYVKLKQTSGSILLDEAAQKTVQQAAPFPVYGEPISLSIHYALSDKPY